MRITAPRTFLVPPRWLLLKVETDVGVVGSGWSLHALQNIRSGDTRFVEFRRLVMG
jgi:DNA-binding HxlR family transcriptional regulator